MEPAGSGATWPKPAARVSGGRREAKPETERTYGAATKDQNPVLFLLSSFPDLHPFASHIPVLTRTAGFGHVAPLPAGFILDFWFSNSSLGFEHQEIVEAGYGDRVMFGSDQMIWPGVIEPSIAAIKGAPFLTAANAMVRQKTSAKRHTCRAVLA